MRGDLGSIIVVVATDAPLLPHQLERIARRATMGIARTGAAGGQWFGRHLHRILERATRRVQPKGCRRSRCCRTSASRRYFGHRQATEEAIVNALVAARTSEGFAGHRAIELSHDRLRAVLAKYNRLRR